MPADPETLLFTRFRDDADVGALGRLYDQTAAELLRVATHLVRDPARAEDLVQQTFVAAIEAAERFDASRRVRAWLLGILANQARKLQREEARRPEGRSEPALDPLAVAQTEEFTAQVDAAISTLPEVYQPVLVLHLKHGMIAAEIAHALRRAPGTVRTQLMRALDLLKRALPASIALAACVMVTPTRGLAAVRQIVLTHAAGRVAAAGPAAVGVGASAGAWSWLGGVLLMKKLVVAIVLLVLAVVLRQMWTGMEPTPPAQPHPRETPAVAQATMPEAGSPPAPSLASESERERQATPTLGSLHYTFLWERDRTPAVAVFVHCMVWGRPNPFLGAIDVATDENGEIALSELEPGDVGIYVDRADGPTAHVVAGEEATGVYLIPRGVTVDLRVQDEAGQPIPGATIWLSHYGNGTKGHEVGVTNGAGRLVVRDVGEARTLAARARGYAPTTQLPVVGKPGERKDAVLVMAAGSATLGGTVRSADGQPCANALVWLGRFPHVAAQDPNQAGSAPPPFARRTDAAGHFEVAELPGGNMELQVRAKGTGTVTRMVELHVGEARQVDVVLPAGASVAGFVRDEEGHGVAGASVGGGAGYGSFGYCSTRTGADGSYELADLTPQRRVTLQAGLEPFLPDQKTVQLEPGERQALDFRLARSQAKDQIRGQLVDERGEPLANWVVSISPIGDGSSTWRGWLRTDAQGHFVVTGCPDLECRLEVFDPGREGSPYPAFAMTGVHRGSDDLRVCVPATAIAFASLRGHVVDADGNALAGATVSVRDPGVPTYQNWRTDADGRFLVEQLPPRTYVLEVSAADQPVLPLGEKALLPEQQMDLGTILMPRGGRLEVRYKPLSFAPSYLHVVLNTASGDQAGYIDLLAEPKTSNALVAGRYELLMTGDGVAAACRDFEIVEGQTTTIELAPEPGAVQQFRVRAAKALAWHRIEVAVKDVRGARVWGFDMPRRGDEALPFAACLGIGDWQVEAKTDTGLVGTVTLHIGDLTSALLPVFIDLR
ncbi:MAG TPA: sigma-70 family RNA polymerase sigma factor [Planctomycetota bacterium]|nr:sigma-70 family RNA polymerase sigma factor [Planctomycetota bacterium]